MVSLLLLVLLVLLLFSFGLKMERKRKLRTLALLVFVSRLCTWRDQEAICSARETSYPHLFLVRSRFVLPYVLVW